MGKGLINVIFIRDNGDIKPYIRKNKPIIKFFGEKYHNLKVSRRFTVHRYLILRLSNLFIEEGNPFPLTIEADKFTNSTQDLDKVISLLSFAQAKTMSHRKDKIDYILPLMLVIGLLLSMFMFILRG